MHHRLGGHMWNSDGKCRPPQDATAIRPAGRLDPNIVIEQVVSALWLGSPMRKHASSPPPADDRRTPREWYQNVPTGPRTDRSKGGLPPQRLILDPRNPDPSTGDQCAPQTNQPVRTRMTDNDLTAIRSRYLGVDKKKRKIRKMNNRKFVFDWDAQDDTFAEDWPVAVGD
ncbi:hypothetical protein Hypma_002015 [Hypsizygus marmoreus]|uniref:Uncharacterized protein n=1 Tax=Hypsizygus marmoreus TaxID=39966 RepID=A0A369JCF9_HYPMA|nr:hypothetical protein Hypma_002015 [Hypsizygus marmoreus]